MKVKRIRRKFRMRSLLKPANEHNLSRFSRDRPALEVWRSCCMALHTGWTRALVAWTRLHETIIFPVHLCDENFCTFAFWCLIQVWCESAPCWEPQQKWCEKVRRSVELLEQLCIVNSFVYTDVITDRCTKVITRPEHLNGTWLICVAGAQLMLDFGNFVIHNEGWGQCHNAYDTVLNHCGTDSYDFYVYY